MWILLVCLANISQEHPVSRLSQQNLLSFLISSTKHMGYYCNRDGSSFLSSPNWGWWEVFETTVMYDPQNQIIKKLLHLSKVWTYILRMLGSVMLSPHATCQFEHRPLQEQLQVCTEHDSYRCMFQLLLQLNT